MSRSRPHRLTRGTACALVFTMASLCCCGGAGALDPNEVECANLVYARTKTAVCFSDGFLRRVKRDTSIRVDPHFRSVKLASDDIYSYPFAIMSGEGYFRLSDVERKNLRNYLLRGGFLLASAGCSNRAWDKAFRTEMRSILPEWKLENLPLDHPVFRTVYVLRTVQVRRSRGAHLEGMTINGRLAVIYSEHGLNSTHNVPGCCCCGANEIRNADEINVNILAYALLH